MKPAIVRDIEKRYKRAKVLADSECWAAYELGRTSDMANPFNHWRLRLEFECGRAAKRRQNNDEGL